MSFLIRVINLRLLFDKERHIGVDKRLALHPQPLSPVWGGIFVGVEPKRFPGSVGSGIF